MRLKKGEQQNKQLITDHLRVEITERSSHVSVTVCMLSTILEKKTLAIMCASSVGQLLIPNSGNEQYKVNSVTVLASWLRSVLIREVSLIDQLHTRAKEFNWRDITSGCSFAQLLPHKVLQSMAKSAGGWFEACGWLN